MVIIPGMAFCWGWWDWASRALNPWVFSGLHHMEGGKKYLVNEYIQLVCCVVSLSQRGVVVIPCPQR